jgi:hypothetical protein
MGKLVSVASSVIDGVLDTGGIVRLGDPPGRLTDGVEKDVVKAGKLKETELPGSEMSEIEPTDKEDNVGKLLLGSNAVLNDTSGTNSESSEVPVNSILEKLVVNTLARSLVGIPPGVIELGVVRPGAVKLTEIEGTEKLPVRISEEGEGRSADRLVRRSEGEDRSRDRLVGSPSEANEMLPVDSVGSTDPILDVPSDEIPDRLGKSEVGAATEVASGMRLDALKVPVVYTVTVYGVYDVTVIEPSQTVRHQSVPRESFQQSEGRTRGSTPNRRLGINTNPSKSNTQGRKAELGWKGQRLHGDGQPRRVSNRTKGMCRTRFPRNSSAIMTA